MIIIINVHKKPTRARETRERKKSERKRKERERCEHTIFLSFSTCSKEETKAHT
jgi:hypothetical protein